MRTLKRFLRILAATLPLLVASGCASADVATAPQAAAPHPTLETSLSRGPLSIPLQRTAHSIVSHFAKAKSPLLFVSDAGTAEVYVFNLTTLALSGTITGFVQPQGECSTSKGDVWITDTDAQIVYEVTHQGGLANELKLKGYPVSCAWDASTGDLAVTSILGTSGASGDVSIYKRGTGTPVSYYDKKAYFYNFAGYDGNGNLFVDGRNERGAFMLMEMAKGSQTLNTLSLKGGRIYFPGMVQWDASGGNLIVGDQSCGNVYSSCLYTTTVQGNTATITSRIALQNSSGGSVCDLVQGVVYNGQLAGSDYDFCGSLPSTTYLWSYPAGGTPAVDNASTDTMPIGATVSL